MDASVFTPNKLGEVRRTLDGHLAYFPNALPREVEYPRQTVHKLTRATGALHRLAGASRLLPSPDILMGPYIRLEAVLSSRIEGTITTVGELLLFEVDEFERNEQRDTREVRNYADALNFALQRLEELPVSLRLLRETHRVLLTGVRGEDRRPGRFRDRQNAIGGTSLGNARFVPPPPTEAMHEPLDDLESFLNEDHGLPPLILLAMAHYQLETIHPFMDGNGRVGRLLIPLVLCQLGVLDRPMLYLSAYFEQHRTAYYDLLFETSATGDLTPWFDFFLDGVTRLASDAERRAERLVDLQERLRADLMESRAPVTTLHLAERLLDRPYLNAKIAMQMLDVSRPTAQSAIDNLVARGILEEITGKQRYRIYRSPLVMEVVYGDVVGTDEGRPPG